MTSKALLLLPLLALGCSKGGDAGCPTGTQATANGLCRAICQHDDDCLLGEHCAVNVCVAGAPSDSTTLAGTCACAPAASASKAPPEIQPASDVRRLFSIDPCTMKRSLS